MDHAVKQYIDDTAQLDELKEEMKVLKKKIEVSRDFIVDYLERNHETAYEGQGKRFVLAEKKSCKLIKKEEMLAKLEDELRSIVTVPVTMNSINVNNVFETVTSSERVLRVKKR